MRKLRVLLVDDEIIIREGFKRLFDWDAHDCEVAGEAADGMEALSRIDTLDPDLVIMDINIPILNGLKVIQLSRIKHPDMAFIIVSGYDDFSYCREALRLQITDYILKPVNYEEFGACIDRLKISLFQRGRSQESASAEEERPIVALPPGAPGGGHQPQHPGGGISPQRAVYQPALQKRDRRELPQLSHRHPDGEGQAVPALHRPAHR